MTFDQQKTEESSAQAYRRGMEVRELMVFPDMKPGISFYICPRCRTTMEREFMHFCDRCGQHLDWRRYRTARIVYPGGQKTGGQSERPRTPGQTVIC